MGEKESSKSIITWILLYSICSSLMLVINKIAMSDLPNAAIVNLFQLVSCTVVILALKRQDIITVDDLEWVKARAYAVYVVIFSCSIYFNMRALEGSNIETIIVFRSITPLVVCLLDYLFMDRAAPTLRSAGGLVMILVGAYVYVINDHAFTVNGLAAYFWVLAYFFSLCFLMTYGKVITDSVQMVSMWGPVLYTNILSIPPTLVMGVCLGDFERFRNMELTLNAHMAGSVLMSCVIGIGIGYSGWQCRSLISATSYTVVGVLNKLVTVFISVILWSNSTGFVAFLSLFLCIMGGAIYQQSPKKSTPLLGSSK